jgi:phage gp37-like protein
MIVELRDTIMAGVQDRLGDAVSVISHGGRFDVDQLRRYTTRAPAIVVSCAGVSKIEIEGNERKASLQWAAIIIARNQPANMRDVLALAMLESLLHLIAGNNWDMNDVHTPTNISATNLFSATSDSLGNAMWALTWNQAIDLPGTFASSLDLFEKLYTKYDLDTTDGIDDDAEDMIQPPQ